MRPVKHQGSDTFLLAALWNVPLAIDTNAHASRKSSIFLKQPFFQLVLIIRSEDVRWMVD